MDALLTNEERFCYRMYRQHPGMSQEAIGQKIGKNQSQISRIIATAEAKVAALKSICQAVGGDPEEVESLIARTVQKDVLTPSPA